MIIIRVNIPLELNFPSVQIISSSSRISIFLNSWIFRFWFFKNHFCKDALNRLKYINVGDRDVTFSLLIEDHNVFVTSSDLEHVVVTEWKRTYHLSVLHCILRSVTLLIDHNKATISTDV